MAANEQCFTVQSVKEPLDMGLGMDKGGGRGELEGAWQGSGNIVT